MQSNSLHINMCKNMHKSTPEASFVAGPYIDGNGNGSETETETDRRRLRLRLRDGDGDGDGYETAPASGRNGYGFGLGTGRRRERIGDETASEPNSNPALVGAAMSPTKKKAKTDQQVNIHDHNIHIFTKQFSNSLEPQCLPEIKRRKRISNKMKTTINVYITAIYSAK